MDNANEIINEYINDLNFKNRPIHINYKYRIAFQVSRLALILGMASSKNGSSILKIQIISDALENKELFNYLDWLINNGGFGFIRSWRYSSVISSAVNYSNAEGLTQYSKTGKIVLTDKGRKLYDEIYDDKNLLCYEKTQLARIKKKLSDTKLLTLLEKGNML